MEKKVRIKISDVVIYMPEKVALQNPFYRALLLQGGTETLQIEVQTLSSDTEIKETTGSVEASEQILLHKTLRKGRRRKEAED
jgi:hypothetical protein